jgi:hypothetical protein
VPRGSYAAVKTKALGQPRVRELNRHKSLIRHQAKAMGYSSTSSAHHVLSQLFEQGTWNAKLQEGACIRHFSAKTAKKTHI